MMEAITKFGCLIIYVENNYEVYHMVISHHRLGIPE